jgi:hypothetical protein
MPLAMLIVSSGTAVKQAFLWGLSALAGGFLLLNVAVRPTPIALVLLAAGGLFLAFLNAKYARLYDVKADRDRVYVSNHYRALAFPLADFEAVSPVHGHMARLLPFAFSSPPYFCLALKDAGRYVFLEMSYAAFWTLFTGNPDAHAQKITQRITTNRVMPSASN